MQIIDHRRRGQKANAQHDPSAVMLKHLLWIYNAPRLKCQWCGKYVKVGNRTVDHIAPLRHGGGDTTANTVMACRTCNASKGAKTPNLYGFLHFDYRIASSET